MYIYIVSLREKAKGYLATKYSQFNPISLAI